LSAAPTLRNRLSLGGASAFVFAFLYLPVAVLVIFSFNDARTGASWAGFTTRWYLSLAENENVREATWNSIYVAGVSTLVAVVLGTMLSLAVDRHAFRGRGVVQQVLYLPVITPEIVTGVSLLAFFSLVLQGINSLFDLNPMEALRLGRPTVVIAHIGFNVAFVALVVRASLRNLDPAMEEASRDLGASAWVTFWRVTLPSIMPGVLGGALLALTLSLDDFVITFFVTGPGGETLPIEIYGELRRTISPEINAISSLLLAASTIALLSALAVQAVAGRRRRARLRVRPVEPRADALPFQREETAM
jgi:spermidine/putrescine transport system permease protein